MNLEILIYSNKANKSYSLDYGSEIFYKKTVYPQIVLTPTLNFKSAETYVR